MFNRFQNLFKSKKLTIEQQKRLLKVYIEREYHNNVNNVWHTSGLDEANTILEHAELPRVNFQGSPETQQEQLSYILFNNIPANQLHILLFSIYDDLHKKHRFDSGFRDAFLPDANDKSKGFVHAIETLKSSYCDYETKQTMKKSRNETILFCLFIVTIPFYKKFYNWRIKTNREYQYHREVFIDDSLLKSMNRTAYTMTPQDEKNENLKRYGLVARLGRTKGERPLKEIIFNKQGDIRKSVSVRGEFGIFLSHGELASPGGVNVITSPPQLNKLKEIASGLKEVKKLARLEPNIQEKIRIYRDHFEEKSSTTCAFWTQRKIPTEVEQEINILKSIDIKSPMPITTEEEFERFSSQKHPDEIIKNIFLGNGTSGDEWLSVLSTENNNDSAIVRCVYGKPPINELTTSRLEKDGTLKIIEVGDSNSANLLEHFDSCCDFIDKAIANGKKVLIHCAAGASRSPTFVAAYLIRRYGLSVDDALNHIKNKRRIVDVKPEFKAQLEEYARKLNKKYQTIETRQIPAHAV